MPLNDMTSVQELFEQLPTEQLREMLDKELHTEPVNADAIRLLMGILRERNKENPVQITPATEQAWEKYQQDSEKIWKGAKRSGKIRNWIIRTASAAAVLAVLLLPIIPQEAGAESLWDTLMRWTSEIVEFFGPKDNEGRIEEYVFQTDNPGLQQVYDAVVELGVTDPVVPMWLPEGAELVEFWKEDLPASSRVHSRFSMDGNSLIFYVDIYNADVSHKYQKDTTETEKYECGGVRHYIMQNNGNMVAVWVRDNIECSFSIDCQEEIIYRIIDSIYVTEDG